MSFIPDTILFGQKMCPLDSQEAPLRLREKRGGRFSGKAPPPYGLPFDLRSPAGWLHTLVLRRGISA